MKYISTIFNIDPVTEVEVIIPFDEAVESLKECIEDATEAGDLKMVALAKAQLAELEG